MLSRMHQLDGSSVGMIRPAEVEQEKDKQLLIQQPLEGCSLMLVCRHQRAVKSAGIVHTAMHQPTQAP